MSAYFAGLDLQRVLFGDVAQRLDFRVAKERVVVEVDLGVEGEELAIVGGDEGIDLDQRGVGFDEGLVEALEEGHRLVDLRGLESQREGQLARLPRAEAHGRVDGLLEDGLGSLGGDFFNLHAAGLRSHEDQLAGGAVEHDAQIELAFNGRGLFDQQPLHLLALGTGLVGDQLHAENVLDVQFCVFAGAGNFDAAAFAAASGVNLRLDHDARGAFGKQFAGHAAASSGVLATSPLGTATPYFARISFA